MRIDQIKIIIGDSMGKSKMTQKAARRIQSNQDKKGSKGDAGFKSRAMSAAAKNNKKWKFIKKLIGRKL